MAALTEAALELFGNQHREGKKTEERGPYGVGKGSSRERDVFEHHLRRNLRPAGQLVDGFDTWRVNRFSNRTLVHSRILIVHKFRHSSEKAASKLFEKSTESSRKGIFD
jgi:hypothetical protein